LSTKAKLYRDGIEAMAEQPASDIDVAENWVNVTEAAEITGYSRDRVQRIAYNNWNLPESEREIIVQRRSHGYMIWLPSLKEYIKKPTSTRGGRGPRAKRKNPKP
jgi:hypothetical protein